MVNIKRVNEKNIPIETNWFEVLNKFVITDNKLPLKNNIFDDEKNYFINKYANIVNNLLNNVDKNKENIEIDNNSVCLLVVVSICNLSGEDKKVYSKLIEEIRLRGIFDYLGKLLNLNEMIKNYLNDFNNIVGINKQYDSTLDINVSLVNEVFFNSFIDVIKKYKITIDDIDKMNLVNICEVIVNDYDVNIIMNDKLVNYILNIDLDVIRYKDFEMISEKT